MTKLQNALGAPGKMTAGNNILFGKKDIFIVSLEILGILVNFI